MNYTTYDLSTGRLKSLMSMDPEMARLNINPSEEGLMEGHFDPQGFYLRNGSIVEYPAKPNKWCKFDYDAHDWKDPRNAEQHLAQLIEDRLEAVAQINEVAGRIRRQYVTDIPGQDALYLLKEAEARRWLTSKDQSLDDFPLIKAEIGITAPSADEVAQVYANLSAIYVQAAARLETLRLFHITIAENAPTKEAAEKARRDFVNIVTPPETGHPYP